MIKAVLVTGACINTGVDIVNKFAGEGYNVIFTGRDEKTVKEMQKKYAKAFSNVTILGYTLSSLDKDDKVNQLGIKNLFSDLDKKNIYINALILNAADQGLNQKIFESSIQDFSRVINTNVIWNYAIIEEGAKRMKDNGGGSVVLVNSNTAYRAIPDRIAYEASKSGQLGLMRGLALDLGKYGIRVNAVLPGMIKTDRWDKNPEFYNNAPSRFTPLQEVATGADVADAIYFLTVSARNTTGAELTVDGGNMIQLYPIIPRSEK